MKPNNKIFDYILITLAIFSISYFILLILNSRFITSYILYLTQIIHESKFVMKNL